MTFETDTSSTDDRLRFTMRLAGLRQKQFSAFADDSLAWLAMPPAWTEPLAKAAGFPTGSLNLPEFLDSTDRAGLSSRGPPVDVLDLSLRRTRALMALWRSLNEKQRKRVVRHIAEGLNAVPDEIERLRLQIAILPFSQSGPSGADHDSQLESLLTEIGKQPVRSKALLMTRLVAVDRSARSVDAAVAAVRAITDPEDFCRFLAAVIPAASEYTSLPDEGRTVAARIEDPDARADALLVLAAPLASGPMKRALQEGAVASIAAIGSAQARADALKASLTTLEPSVRERAAALALDAAPAITNVAHRAHVLAALSTVVMEGQRNTLAAHLRAAAESVSAVHDPAERDAASAAIAVALATIGRADDALALARGINAPASRALAVVGIGLYQPEKLASEVADVFSLSLKLPPATQEALFAGLPAQSAGYLSRQVTAAVVQRADAMISDRRFEPALRLIKLLNREDATPLLNRMLTIAGLIGNERERTGTLAQLAPHLSTRMLDQAIKMVAEARSPDRLFSMPDVVRADALQYLRERPNALPLQTEAQKAGIGVLSALEKQRFDVPPATLRWAEIASKCDDLGKAADFVADKVNLAVEAGDLGDALEYAKATNELAGPLGGEVELAVTQAQHRIGLAFRKAADERHLLRFLPRQEHSDAIKDLLEDGTPHWAIHFLGPGGVGKTMLMRQLTARLAVKHGTRLPTSRVDFDLVSPEYPARQPGQLLAVLAEELRMFGGDDQEDRYRKFQGDLNEFHGALGASRPPDDPLQNIELPGFERLLHAFTALLHGLPKPIIFILDTCEELAKLDPVGSRQPSVEATFRIIERVHAQEAGIRVVFAGRRPLARSGGLLPNGQCQWTARADKLPERSKILPERKEYLRLQVMRGFSEGEADDYFSRIVGVSLAKDQREAILRSSRDVGIPAEIDFGASPAGPDEALRYNPFDLSLYADWVTEDPKVTAATLGSGETDPYVEMRIIQRIADDDLRNAIPYAVQLRRFDMDMLQPAARTGGDELVRLFRDLGGQEWMEYQQDALQVDPEFLQRLRNYYEDPSRRSLLDQARARLAPTLISLVRKFLDAQDPFKLLAVRHLDAVLRLASKHVAAELWDSLDRRLFESGNWYWAETVCRFLLDKENAAGDESSWLHGAVRATYNSALAHTQPRYPMRDAWKGVAELARHHPIPQIGAFIELRSRLWTEPLRELRNAVVDFEGDNWQQEQLGASLAAALERELEKPDPVDFRYGPWISAIAFSHKCSPEVRASLACSLARCTRKRSDLSKAKVLAAELSAQTIRQRWGDWRAPAALASRIRLELLRIYSKAADRAELERWTVTAAENVDTIDGERLLSRTLSLLLEYGPIDPPKIAAHQIYDPQRRPECCAHFETPPLVGPFVDAALSRRLDDQWLDRVSCVRTQALANQDEIGVQAADVIKLKLKYRLRTPRAMQALAALVPVWHPGSAKFHQWWAVQTADSAKLLERLNQLTAADILGDDKELDLFSALDLCEGKILAERIGQEGSNLERLQPMLSYQPRIRGPSVVLRLEDGEASHIRVELRSAVVGEPPTSWEEDPRIAKPRRLAEIALEEGDLLALRLPERAIRLFETAHRLFLRAGDPLGENICAICAAMAACRVGDKGCAAEWLQRVAPEYRTEAISAEGVHAAWLLRAAACSAWIDGSGSTSPRATRVADQIARRYGNVLPPELAFAPAAPEQATLPPSAKLDFLSSVTAAVGAVVGGLVSITHLGEIPKLARTLSGTLSVLVGVFLSARVQESLISIVEIFAKMLAVLAVFAISAALFWVYWWVCLTVIRGPIAHLVFLALKRSIVIEPNPDSSRILLQLNITPVGFITRTSTSNTSHRKIGLRVLIARLFVPWVNFQNVHRRVEIERPKFQSYGKASSTFPKDITRYLQTFAIDRLFSLSVEDSIAQYAWEAVIGLNARDRLGWVSRGTIHLVRTGEPLPLIPEGLMACWDTASICVVSRHGLGMKVWSPLRGIDVRAFESLPIPPPSPLRVLHLIGRARRGASGAIFSIRGQGSDLGELVSIGQLPLSSAAIVIVQEEPAERLRRLDVDREQTGDARDWAAQVFLAGAQTVILVPAMPLDVAEQAVSAMARKLNGRRPPDAWRLVEAVRVARSTVVSFRRDAQRAAALTAGLDDAARKEAQRELAMDITLFSRAQEFQAANPFTGFTSTGAPQS